MRQFIDTLIRKIFELVFSIYKPKVRMLYWGRNIDLGDNGDLRIKVGVPFYLAGFTYKLDQRDKTSVFRLALYKKSGDEWERTNDVSLIMHLNMGFSIFYV